jgi:hypothetical protein
MTGKEKHVSFQSKEEDQRSAPGFGGTVASVVDTGIGAVAQAGTAVLSHVPGTDEHALHQCKKEIERTGVDYHVADGKPMPRQQKHIEKTEGKDARKLHKTTSIHPDYE